MEVEVTKENKDLEERGSFKTDRKEEDKENIQDLCLDRTKEEDEEILHEVPALVFLVTSISSKNEKFSCWINEKFSSSRGLC